jgi:hypothetical protein
MQTSACVGIGRLPWLRDLKVLDSGIISGARGAIGHQGAYAGNASLEHSDYDKPFVLAMLCVVNVTCHKGPTICSISSNQQEPISRQH